MTHGESTPQAPKKKEEAMRKASVKAKVIAILTAVMLVLLFAGLLCLPPAKQTRAEAATTVSDAAGLLTAYQSAADDGSVTSIGDGAFFDCDSLTNITIPDSVTSIGDWAFDYCYSLTTVYYAGTEEQWNEIVIGEYNEDLTNATIYFKGEW